MVARLSAIDIDHILPPRRFLVLIYVRGSVNPRATLLVEGLSN
jgi:hypothetical protein